jgi:hypothetical protein
MTYFFAKPDDRPSVMVTSLCHAGGDDLPSMTIDLYRKSQNMTVRYTKQPTNNHIVSVKTPQAGKLAA